MRIIRLIRIISITIIALNASSQIEDNPSIELKLNKTKFCQGDTLKMSITNITNDTFYIASIYFSKDCIKLKMKNKQEWEDFIIHKFSEGMISGGRYQFLPGEKIEFLWDQSYIENYEHPFKREYVPKGIYKIEFNFGPYTKIPKMPTERFACYSETFKIK